LHLGDFGSRHHTGTRQRRQRRNQQSVHDTAPAKLLVHDIFSLRSHEWSWACPPQPAAAGATSLFLEALNKSILYFLSYFFSARRARPCAAGNAE
jgi:hypothetical protein